MGDLARLLSTVFLEVRKKTGEEFPPNTTSSFHIVSGIQRHVRMNGKPAINFFKDSELAHFRIDLDAEMKHLK